MNPVCFLGNSLKSLRNFPSSVLQDAGYQLEKVQLGLQPDDFKPMPSVGKGVEELRLWDEPGTYRIIYYAKMQETIYVLHVFQKKSQATSSSDSQLAKARYLTLKKQV